MFFADQVFERRGRSRFRGDALNEHPFIRASVFPARRGIHVFEFAGLQRPPDFSQRRPFRSGLDHKIGEAGDVVGIRTDEFRHG